MQDKQIRLISGAYTASLWEGLEDMLTNENSPSHIYTTLKALYEAGLYKEAIALVQVLYDITGLALPDIVECMADNYDMLKAYTAELLTDIENII